MKHMISILFLGLLSVSSLAQQNPEQRLQQMQQQAQQQAEQYRQQTRQGQLLPGESSAADLLPQAEAGYPAPYGANLFAGGYESEQIDGLNDDYLIAAGDKINIWLWGAVEYADVATVDNQANIFIPQVGPINIGGVKASRVNAVVTSALRRVYQSNVQIYVNLLTATPVSVYIAGPVLRPGQYAGMASDSILYYLKRAGGIDADRGSYRKISVMRAGEIIATVDLYDFIQHGQLLPITFKDKDTILVSPRGATVTVSEGASNAFRFELQSDSASGQELIQYAKPLSNMSHVGVAGTRQDGPYSLYFPIDEFADFILQDGDKLLFNDDWDAQVYDIRVSGSHLGASYYTVKRQTRLKDFLQHVQIDPTLTDYQSVYVLRKSVAERQKEMIDQSLDRLERSVFTAPVQSSGEGSIRAQEAGLISDFVARAKQIRPLGKVIVSENGQVADILLENGDEIVLPQKTDLIHVGGEVLMPQSVVYNPDAGLEDYISWAGGYTERANFERIVIVHANGLTDFVEPDEEHGWFGADNQIALQKGDQILVLPRVDAKTLQAVKDMTQIIYQIAIAANVAVR